MCRLSRNGGVAAEECPKSIHAVLGGVKPGVLVAPDRMDILAPGLGLVPPMSAGTCWSNNNH